MLTRQMEKKGKSSKCDAAKESKEPAAPPPSTSTGEEGTRELEILEEIRGLRQEHAKAVSDNEKTLQRLEISIKDMAEKITKVEQQTTALEERQGETEDRVTHLEKSVTYLLERESAIAAKCDDLEARSRRNNVRIHGIAEGAEKNDTIGFIKNLIRNCLKLPADLDLHLERAHRTPMHKQEGKAIHPRVILACFLHHQVKELILQQAWKQKPMYDGHPVYFNRDYTSDTQKKRKQVREVIKLLKDKNIKAQSPYPAQLKIFTDGGTKTFPTLAAAVPTLRDMGVNIEERNAGTLRNEMVRGMWSVVTERGKTSRIMEADK